MSIKTRCPSCDAAYSLDDGLAGKKAKCAKCGGVMTVPAAAGPAAGAPAAVEAAGAPAAVEEDKVRFRCEGCGQKYSLAANLAGKRVVCKACGAKIEVPGGAKAKAKPDASLRVDPGGPPSLDIFGLDDEPAAPARRPSGDGILADEVKPAAASSAADDGPLPPRAGYGEMTEAKKKKIARRAAKADRMKPSYGGAAVGVSFGAVLAFALLGWRIYRTVNRVVRVAGGVSAIASGPREPGEAFNLDPKALAAEADKEMAREVSQPTTAEAREWLDPNKHPDHGVMEMDPVRARTMVAGFYDRGAEGVYVIDPTQVGPNVITAEFVVKLPADPEQRQKCLEWETQSLQDEEPTQDYGQKYLMILTD